MNSHPRWVQVGPFYSVVASQSSTLPEIPAEFEDLLLVYQSQDLQEFYWFLWCQFTSKMTFLTHLSNSESFHTVANRTIRQGLQRDTIIRKIKGKEHATVNMILMLYMFCEKGFCDLLPPISWHPVVCFGKALIF